MITFDFLKNHPESIPKLAELAHEAFRKISTPNTSIADVIKDLSENLNEDKLPITLVAIDGNKPAGMCTLCENDGIRPDLTPWLASLIVDPEYRNQGIGKLLIEKIKDKAKELSFDKLYLFAFELTTVDYYQHLGWSIIATDHCEGYPVTVMEIKL